MRPLKSDCLAEGRFCFLKSVRGFEYPAEIAVTHRQCAADVEPVGDVFDELFSNHQSLRVRILSFLRPPRLEE